MVTPTTKVLMAKSENVPFSLFLLLFSLFDLMLAVSLLRTRQQQQQQQQQEAAA